jgi:hypothetical protein
MRRPRIYSSFSREKLPGYYSVPPGMTYEDIVEAVKGRFGGQQLAAGYRPQLQARTYVSSESLQFSRPSSSRLTRPLSGYPRTSSREATYAFVDEVMDQDVKQHLLMGGETCP